MNYIFVISLRTTEHGSEEEDGEEGEREAVRRRMERKGEKGSEEDDYFNKFPPTMPSVVLENRLIKMFKPFLPFLSILFLTASLSPSSPSSSSLPLSLLPSHHPHYLSPSFLFSTSLPPCSPLLTTTLINFPRQCLQWFLKID
jgi:hypothetical protein